MVINDKYRFIFIHVPKTAGRSLKAALSELPGDNVRWLATSNHEDINEFFSKWKHRRSTFDKIMWRSPKGYKTFGFVRNPWARISSLYRYLIERSTRKPGIRAVKSFEDFIFQFEDHVKWIRELHSFRPQLCFFADETGSADINYVGHFEYLSDDISEIKKILNINFSLKHLNRTSSSERDYRKDYTSSRVVDIVHDHFERDVRQFGYEFDRILPRYRCSGPLQISAATAFRMTTSS